MPAHMNLKESEDSWSRLVATAATPWTKRLESEKKSKREEGREGGREGGKIFICISVLI